MVSFSSVVALALGLFEFFLVVKTEFLNDHSTLNQLKLFPAIFQSDRSVFLLLMAFTTFLGLVRVSYAVSGKTVMSWITVVLAHVAEGMFLWNLALQPHFNTRRLPLIDLAKDLVSMKHDVPSTALLFLVPVFALFFLLSGPGATNGKKEKSN